MHRQRNSERGQVIILLAVGLVALFGFAALAIDGGLVYAERRHAQNAADASTMTAAMARINANSNWKNVALDLAAKNGFDNDGVSNTVEVHSPPVSGPFAGQANHVQTIISSNVNTFLVHFVYQGEVKYTVDAVVDYVPGFIGPLYSGDALVGLNPSACDTIRAGGTSGTEIIGGGVFVNSNHPDCAFRRHGTGDFKVVGGSINVVGGWKNDGSSGTITPTPSTDAEQVPYPPEPDIPAPTCPNVATVSGDRILPGRYSGAKFPPNGVTKFGYPGGIDPDTGLVTPSIFCIDVSDKFHLKSNVYEGVGVLFYMQNGNVEWNADAEINLSPPTTGDYRGLLIYMDPKNYVNPPNSEITVNGKQESRIAGTIWGPASHCKLNGTGDSYSYRLQVVCYTIELLGNAKLYIDDSFSDFYEREHPAKIKLSK
jgi:Flp pilus assembly protein TadG